MKKVNPFELQSEFYITTISKDQFSQLVDLINHSYTHVGIEIEVEQVRDWTKAEVYAPDLWTAIYKDDIMVGAVVADFDKESKEVIIEWLQVAPEYRGRGIALALLSNILQHVQEKADFVTVSGMVHNKTKPEMIYRKCGFTGNDIWHILFRKNMSEE